MKIVIIEPLGITGHEIVAYDTKEEDQDKLAERGKDADIIIIANQPFRKNVIEKCKNLKLLSVAFTGVDHIDVDFCKEKGICVCNAAGYSTNAVAELAFGLAISVLRNIPACDAVCRKEGTKAGLVGCELFGKTFGVVGTGAIGSKVANVPLNDKTKGLIGEKEIALMKKNAILLNTARGPVVDSEALAKALNEERIAGAGIDVFEMEPPVPAEHPLLHSKHTVVTPHVAFASHEALFTRAQIVSENILKWEDGKPQNVIY